VSEEEKDQGKENDCVATQLTLDGAEQTVEVLARGPDGAQVPTEYAINDDDWSWLQVLADDDRMLMPLCRIPSESTTAAAFLKCSRSRLSFFVCVLL
jgi:hypothetical protein